MAAVAVEQQPERTARSHAVAQTTQKAVEVGQALVAAGHQHAPAHAQVERAEKRAARVGAADPNLRLLAAQSPRRP